MLRPSPSQALHGHAEWQMNGCGRWFSELKFATDGNLHNCKRNNNKNENNGGEKIHCEQGFQSFQKPHQLKRHQNTHARWSQVNYKVAILYRLTNLPSACIPNNWLGYPGESGHINAICCGPSDDHGCIVGPLIKSCATALKLECVIPLQQNSFHSTHCCVVLVPERHFGCISGLSGQSSLVHKMERKKALTKV